jgi:hypothetical protein
MERGTQEDIGANTATKIRSALTLYQPLREIDQVEIRMYRMTLYSSIYRADDELLCSQHAYGICPARSPVLHLQHQSDDDLAHTYLNSFDRLWSEARP